ncbi:MAG TPA: glycosyltransferase family 4 protein [Candidatus Limnocylindrales bacterium]|nr:glycosyltransferase family 4 protein [Candidatus Limnocylindrales bacterium]
MKVVVAHNLYSSAQPSGENTVVGQELEALLAAGIEVLPFLRSSDEIATMPAFRRALLPVSPVYAHAAQRELALLCRRERPDVLHLHNPYPLLSPWVVRTAQAHGVAVVQTVHNYRHVCVSGLHYRDGHTCHDCSGLAWAAPAVRHACYRGSAAQSAVMATALAVHRSTWKRVDRFVALTPKLAEFLRGIGIDEERIVVKPNAVPDPGRHSQRGQGFLFAGRLSAEKGVLELLAAWESLPSGSLGHLTFAGDGPLRCRISDFAASRADVHYAGKVGAPRLRELMRDAAAVVVPSTFDDICPLVAIEALANSRPVLGSDRGGLPFVIGPAGWIAPPSSLAAALKTAYAQAAGLTSAARSRYEELFEPAALTCRLITIYQQALSARLSRGRP